MGQQNISNGQTPLLVSDITTIIQLGDSDYYKTGVDFLTPYKKAIPKYVTGYQGKYYRKASNSSAPTAFPSEQAATNLGKTYEIDIPSDCIDDGIESVEVYYGGPPATTQYADLDILKVDDESAWDLASGKVQWRNAGRKARFFVPAPVSSSAGLAYQLNYIRYGTYPSATNDTVDVPAEDIDTFIDTYYKPEIIKL